MLKSTPGFVLRSIVFKMTAKQAPFKEDGHITAFDGWLHTSGTELIWHAAAYHMQQRARTSGHQAFHQEMPGMALGRGLTPDVAIL